MPRPKTKEQLLSLSQENFDRLFSLIEPLSSEDRSKPGVNGEWSVKKDSHQKMMALISGHTDEELFTKKRYKWTGSTSLGKQWQRQTW